MIFSYDHRYFFRYLETDGEDVIDPTSVALRVLCSMFETDAGARKRTVNLKQWLKQYVPCVKARMGKDDDPVAWLVVSAV